MDELEVRRWYDAYLVEFAALGRGDVDDVRRILAYYGVPMLFSTDAGTTMLADEAQVLAAAQQQFDGMRSSGYDRSEPLGAADTTVLNRSCAVHRAGFARLTADGAEISRLEATYLITDTTVGRRMSALVVSSGVRPAR